MPPKPSKRHTTPITTWMWRLRSGVFIPKTTMPTVLSPAAAGNKAAII